MGTAPAFASVSEALDMVQAGLSYLAAADAAQLPAATQAECLRRLERNDAIATAARAFILAGFTAGQGYADDADYSAVAWLIHQTRITRGAAVGHIAWAGRVDTHARVLTALAAGLRPGPTSRWPTCCCWTTTRRCRRNGLPRSAPGGPRTGRSPPRPAARAAPGWTGRTPRRSPVTPPCLLSSPATSISTPWKTWSGSASNWTPGGTAGGMPPGRRWSRRSSAKP
jgi:hypothetical protein